MAKEPANTVAGCLVGVIGLLMMAGAGGIILAHMYQWMKYGTWPSYSTVQLFRDVGLPYPRVSWIGVQHVIDWAMRAHAATFIFFCGLAVAMLGGWLMDQQEQGSKDARSKEGQAPR
jgi:hypothetical protein